MTGTPRDTISSAEARHAFPLATLAEPSEAQVTEITNASPANIEVNDLAQKLMAFADALTKVSPLAIQRLRIELPEGEAVALVFPLDRWQITKEGYLRYVAPE